MQRTADLSGLAFLIKPFSDLHRVGIDLDYRIKLFVDIFYPLQIFAGDLFRRESAAFHFSLKFGNRLFGKVEFLQRRSRPGHPRRSRQPHTCHRG